jgi:hypothetical protein
MCLCFCNLCQDEGQQPPAAYIQKENKYAVILEGFTAATVDTVPEGLMALFICHYVFNLQYGDGNFFYLFVQTYLVGMKADGKAPAKISTFADKL